LSTNIINTDFVILEIKGFLQKNKSKNRTMASTTRHQHNLNMQHINRDFTKPAHVVKPSAPELELEMETIPNGLQTHPLLGKNQSTASCALPPTYDESKLYFASISF
jgi:hypothetical protein